jgi:hypothetical protein
VATREASLIINGADGGSSSCIIELLVTGALKSGLEPFGMDDSTDLC